MSASPTCSVSSRAVPEVSARSAVTVRTTGDRCPGAMRLHEAADGPLARIRIPGGLVSTDAALALAELAESVGDGHLHLTVRGNVELRGIRDATALADGLTAAGLLPSTAHERARNIVASPFAGLDGQGADTGTCAADLVRVLDAAICAEPALARLSGRFLFGVDDGRGDVIAQRPDLGAFLLDGDRARLVVDGVPTATVLAVRDVPEALVAAALAFLASAQVRDGGAWRIRDAASPEWTAHLASAARRAVGSADAATSDAAPQPTRADRVSRPTHVTESALHPAVEQRDVPDRSALPDHPVGIVARRSTPQDSAAARVTVGAILELAATDAATWRAVAEHSRRGDGLVRTTPWRGILLGGLSPTDADAILRDLRRRGLVTDADDPRRRLSACTGLPGCARSLADVRSAALASATSRQGVADDVDDTVDPDLRAGRTVYWAGCDRHCGHPGGPHIAHTATRDGYVTT